MIVNQTHAIDAQHRLIDAQWRATEHAESRPGNRMPELVVIHCVSLPEGEFGTGYPHDLFVGCLDCAAHPTFADLRGVRVAPHLLIDRQGHVQQYVRFDRAAWHAGLSSWRGRSGCNGYSIGIELEGSVHTAFTLAQYDTLLRTCTAILGRYSSISIDSIVGHNEIAPGRKGDPGPFFDWCGFLVNLHRRMTSETSRAETGASGSMGDPVNIDGKEFIAGESGITR